MLSLNAPATQMEISSNACVIYSYRRCGRSDRIARSKRCVCVGMDAAVAVTAMEKRCHFNFA